MTLTKPLDHDNAAVVMFRAEVTDVNANPEYANQTDIGVLTQKFFYFHVRNDFFLHFPFSRSRNLRTSTHG